MELLAGFLLGILASGIAALVYEYASRPFLETVTDDSGRAQGQLPDAKPHEFYHLKVRNRPAKWPLPGRKPGWSSKATIEIFNTDGSRVIENPIPARWTSQPEPLIPILQAGQPANLLDPAKIITGRRLDVHGHEDQQLSIAIKFEGEPECHIFSNESYQFQRWRNPAWCLKTGTYRLRVTLFYERGRSQNDFELRNSGPSRNDLRISNWAR
ncbi:MAG: hypothetical protein KKI12_06310 [Proteobacteria bacterium]|nr:hypothetical protein [Pseudomonadota bacterium]MBU4287770.1 hypothetical protein [Pseudomonadota bacterium]MBU4413582.1 hypothetical protein [Pseudomonadota bacterium]MCG2758402.1 hypothetical protein [Desulfobacteraceae bacterium]